MQTFNSRRKQQFQHLTDIQRELKIMPWISGISYVPTFCELTSTSLKIPALEFDFHFLILVRWQHTWTTLVSFYFPPLMMSTQYNSGINAGPPFPMFACLVGWYVASLLYLERECNAVCWALLLCGCVEMKRGGQEIPPAKKKIHATLANSRFGADFHTKNHWLWLYSLYSTTRC